MTNVNQSESNVNRGAPDAEFGGVAINGREVYVQETQPSDGEVGDIWIDASEAPYKVFK
jgi:hypothetical protein